MNKLLILLSLFSISISGQNNEKADQMKKKATEIFKKSPIAKSYMECIKKVKTKDDHKKCMVLREKMVEEMKAKMLKEI